MAAFNIMNIMNHTRPCWVNGRRAIFHRWTDSARPVKPRGVEDEETTERYQLHTVHALVEYEDGTMSRVWPRTVQFADSERLFSEYDWEGMEEAARAELPYTFDEVADAQTAEHIPGNLRNCLNCGATPAKENCGYNCDECVRKCHCRECNGASEWIPKGGTA